MIDNCLKPKLVIYKSFSIKNGANNFENTESILVTKVVIVAADNSCIVLQ